MRWDLRTPCKNCPFRTDETAIRFACRDRAEEIAESAYRNGFPCHLSATLDEDDEDGGYEFGDDTQHCAGATLLFLKASMGGNIPFERLSDHLQEAIERRLDWDAPVHDGEEAFLESYGPEETEAA